MVPSDRPVAVLELASAPNYAGGYFNTNLLGHDLNFFACCFFCKSTFSLFYFFFKTIRQIQTKFLVLPSDL